MHKKRLAMAADGERVERGDPQFFDVPRPFTSSGTLSGAATPRRSLCT